MKRQLGSFYYKPKSREGAIRRKRWHVPSIIGRIVRKTCMVLGAIMLFSIVMSILSGVLLSGSKTSLPKDMILVLNVESGIGESGIQSSLIDPFAMKSITTHDLVSTLHKAKGDKRVRGLIVSLDHAGIELAHIQEIRTAVKEFRENGKFAHLYTPSFADLGSGIGAYYLASAFDEIWMQPVGMVTISGLSIEMPFAKEALDKIGAKAQFFQREEYKSAMESFTNESMSPANQESMASILNDLSAQILTDISFDRKLEPAALRQLVDKGLLTGEEALQGGLIDRIDYADILVSEVREKITGEKKGEEPPLVLVEDYLVTKPFDEYKSGRKDIALVSVSGQIVPGSQPESGYATADYIAQAIHEAADDDAIEAIVLRVDSPGGSPTASETIRRAIVYAKGEGKKIVVSMGPVAASGGYWVSVDADHIFAAPSTLTGSIGVIMGKFEVSKLWEKLGINWDTVRWGQNAGMWSVNEGFTETERARMNVAIDSTYEDFLTRVAEGRNMKTDDVRKVAKGRPWTGAQAKGFGLVDSLGGLDEALDYTAQQVGLKSRDDVNIVIMPKPLTAFEQLMMLMGHQVAMGKFLQSHAQVFENLKPAVRAMDAVQRGGALQAYDSDVQRLKN